MYSCWWKMSTGSVEILGHNGISTTSIRWSDSPWRSQWTASTESWKLFQLCHKKHLMIGNGIQVIFTSNSASIIQNLNSSIHCHWNLTLFFVKYRYLITPSTVVTFLSHTYRLALCLDLSPSAAAVDMVTGTIVLDEILTSFRLTRNWELI